MRARCAALSLKAKGSWGHRLIKAQGHGQGSSREGPSAVGTQQGGKGLDPRPTGTLSPSRGL